MLLTFIISAILFYTPLPFGEQELKYDENGRIIFTEIITTDFEPELLLKNAQRALEVDNESVSPDQVKFNEFGSFMLYTKKLSKVPDGRIRYFLEVEVKENRYRYVITDFTFHKYERNRYGRFEELKGKEKRVETLIDNPNKDWKKHKLTIITEIEEVIDQLKEDMTITASTEISTQEIIKLNTDW